MALFMLKARNGFRIFFILLMAALVWHLVIRRVYIFDIRFTSTFFHSGAVLDPASSYLIFTPGCRIPFMDPYDPSVQSLFYHLNYTTIQKSCGTLPPLTYLSQDNKIYLDTNSLELYNITSKTDLQCCISKIDRDSQGADKDEYHYASKCLNITLPYAVTQEYLRLQCLHHGVVIYNDFYATIQIKTEVEKRCEKMVETRRKSNDMDQDRLNVVILTIDSLSRLNFHRQMRLSSRFIVETMAGIEMTGFTKLGDNTFSIITPLLMGLSSDDVHHRCSGTSFDYCPFVWKEFARRGYRTAFGEDAYIIAAFNSNRGGFRKTPTDYYLRPIFAAEYGSVSRTPWNPHDYLCFANRIQAPVLLNWTRDFVATMKDKLHFGYFHSSGLSHDDVNWAQFLDSDVYELLRSSYEGGAFHNTMFILMSDHGMRFGSIRETFLGRLEDSLPLLIVTLPQWFRQKYPHIMQSLQVNSKRLMTAFDIHQTILDVLHSRFHPNDHISIDNQLPKRISLFQEVPMQRTCLDAAIPIYLCACQVVDEGRVESQEVKMAARAVVQEINNETESKRNLCAVLNLKNVLRAEIAKPANSVGGKEVENSIRDVIVTIETHPGEARFEGTVRVAGSNVLNVLGISRVNRYGNQSLCISNFPKLKTYCFCTNN